ncbi:MAG: hypothetical protein OIF58_11430 [Cohaesibacter sp.]|nr:hypothetical protein [Cohaesibacter sp.]
MSTEQPESAHSQGETQAATPLLSNSLQSNNLQGEITQQATSPTPTTKPAKNPKRVAAGKLVAERTRKAREAQKKAAAEAAAIIAKNKAPVPPAAALATEDENPRSILSTTQWLAAGSFAVSLIGLYYKREELKAVFSKKTTPPAPPQPAPAPSKNLPPPPQPKGIRHMD